MDKNGSHWHIRGVFVGRFFYGACLRVLVDPQVILGCSGPIPSDVQRPEHTNARAPRPTQPQRQFGRRRAPSRSTMYRRAPRDRDRPNDRYARPPAYHRAQVETHATNARGVTARLHTCRAHAAGHDHTRIHPRVRTRARHLDRSNPCAHTSSATSAAVSGEIQGALGAPQAANGGIGSSGMVS